MRHSDQLYSAIFTPRTRSTEVDYSAIRTPLPSNPTPGHVAPGLYYPRTGFGARDVVASWWNRFASCSPRKQGCYPFAKVPGRRCSAPLFRPGFFARDRRYYVALNKWVIRGNICLCTSATVLKASETQVKYLPEPGRAPAFTLARDFSFSPTSPSLIPSASPRAQPRQPVFLRRITDPISVIPSNLFARVTSDRRANKQFAARSSLASASSSFVSMTPFYLASPLDIVQ